MATLLRSLQKALRTIRPEIPPEFQARYVGSVDHEDRAPDERSRLKYLGYKVPQLDALYARGFGIEKLPLARQADAWHQLFMSSQAYDEMSLAFRFFNGTLKREELPRYWPKLKQWAKRIDNWAHSDSLSYLFAQLLEDQPALVLATLKKWNRAREPWLRRQSVVSLLYYSSMRRKTLPLSQILEEFVEPLLEDPHFFVQKGVGWTLREVFNLDPRAQERFVRKHLHRITAVAYYATTEKYSPKLKAELKAKRKQLRAKR